MQKTARQGYVDLANVTINNYLAVHPTNGLISSSLTYEDVGSAWLGGVPDQEATSPLNWIRAGKYENTEKLPTIANISADDFTPFQDLNGDYEKILGGTWAPYYYANKENVTGYGLGLMYYKAGGDRLPTTTFNCNSVDVVFTSDRSKWTQCPVIEMSDGNGPPDNTPNGNQLSEGGAYKFNLRNHASLEKEPNADGSPKYSTTETGRGWFPGYAINVETGERLSIVYGEDSGEPLENGTDMMYNPTSNLVNAGSKIVWGGKHAIYISKEPYNPTNDVIYNRLKQVGGLDPIVNDAPGLQKVKRAAYAKMMWVTPSLKLQQKNFTSWKDGLIPTKTTVKIRVTRPYTTNSPSATLLNKGFPVYRFDASKILASKLTDAGNQYNQNEDALLKRLAIVPNPYYAYSEYELTRLDNRVKIINLPAVATIKIYSTDGTLIKTINKADSGSTYVEWDLKNEKAVPISSGMYLIHVKIKTDQGEKETVLKWFGIMRPTDITAF